MLFAPGHFTSDFFTQIEFAPLWENYRVIAPNYPGRGQSTKIDGSDDFTKIASRLERWAKSLECQNIHAIGMSFGTAVITEMLVINPSIFSKITLVAGGEFLSKRADALVKTIFLPALFSEKIRQRYRQFFSNRFSIFRNLPHDGLKELNEQWFAVLDYKLPRKKTISIPAKLVQLQYDHVIDRRSRKTQRKIFTNHNEVMLPIPHQFEHEQLQLIIPELL